MTKERDATRQAQQAARQTIAQHSKSFSLAARLLPADVAADAVVLYAWCRHADDLIDLAPTGTHAAALARLADEIAACHGREPLPAPELAALRDVVRRRRIPQAYFDEFVAGLAMDADGVAYDTWERLILYCHRVAGIVGLMMCHVMGVRDDAGLAHAADLGIAMQLTNIARDVVEDWERGRLYLPDELLASCGAPALRRALGQPFPTTARRPVAAAIAVLLDRADELYVSGDAGMRHLSTRCRFAVGTARRVYAGIGRVLRDRGCDPLSGRAVVSPARKLAAVAGAALDTARDRQGARTPVRPPATTLGTPAGT